MLDHTRRNGHAPGSRRIFRLNIFASWLGLKWLFLKSPDFELRHRHSLKFSFDINIFFDNSRYERQPLFVQISTIVTMRLQPLILATLSVGLGQAAPASIAKTPAPATDSLLSDRNLLTSTASANLVGNQRIAPRSYNTFDLQISNNFTSGRLRAYISGRDSHNALVFVTAAGEFFAPQSNSVAPVMDRIDDGTIGIEVAEGESRNVSIPGELTSGRIYLSREASLEFNAMRLLNGTVGLEVPDAANKNDESKEVRWGFAEFTFKEGGGEGAGLTLNPSYVDFAPPFSIDVSATDEESGETYTTKGLPNDGLERICELLKSQAGKDRMPWDKLCITDKEGSIVRVLSPNIYRSRTHDPQAFDGYFEPYITKTWEHFSSSQKTLDFDTQFQALQNVSCHLGSADGEFNCDNNGSTIAKPTTADIFSCSTGAFTNSGSPAHKNIVARLCAAFVRGTILPPNSNTSSAADADIYNLQPSSNLPASAYYKNEVCNHYARIVHEVLPEGKGYAFSYDDVNPTETKATVGGGADGTIKVSKPAGMAVVVS